MGMSSERKSRRTSRLQAELLPTHLPPQVGIMASALAAWMLTLAIYAFARGRARAAGSLFLSGTSLLHPTAAGAAFGLLSCQTVVVKPVAVASLDGGTGYAGAGGDLVSVPLLFANPFYVCFAGSHRPAAVVAATTIAAFVALFPLATWAMLRKDPWLRSALAAQALAQGPTDTSGRVQSVAAIDRKEASFAVGGGIASQVELPAVQHASGGDAPAAPQLDLPAEDPFLRPILGDSGYLFIYWWFGHVELFATLALAALEAFIPRPVTAPQASLLGALGDSKLPGTHALNLAPIHTRAARRQACRDSSCCLRTARPHAPLAAVRSRP